MAVLTSPAAAPSDAQGGQLGFGEHEFGFRHFVLRAVSPSVAELSAKLYGAYEVLGGSVRLAGCAIQQRPTIRLSRRADAAADSQYREMYVADDGETLSNDLARLLQSQPFEATTKPPKYPAASLHRLVDQAKWQFAERCRAAGESDLDLDSIEVEVLWRHYAEGKLRFSINDRSLDLPFGDWADSLLPPRLICPETGTETYRIASLDDGRIVAAEEIAECKVSHARILRCETVHCAVTGKRIAADLAELCPVTKRHVLRPELRECPHCQLAVAPQALTAAGCVACATSVSVKKSDPRMCLVLGEHPRLDRWRRWRLSETPMSYVLEGRSLSRRLLVVVEKSTLEVRRLAQRGRFRKAWKEIAREHWRDYL